MYTITLDDGRKLTNLGKNADNFVSETRIDESIFEDNLDTMIVSDGNTEETYHNMVFIQQMEWEDGTFYLTFREKSERELIEDVVTGVQMALVEIYELVLTGGM